MVLPMQIQPLVTVKKAASLLGLEKNELRRRLVEGAVKGEQRKVGDKEKWFIYSGELDHLLSQRFSDMSSKEERTSLEGIEDFFGPPSAAESNANTASEAFTSVEIVEPLETTCSTASSHCQATPNSLQSIKRTEITLPEPSFEEIIHSLTMEFSYRLAQERLTIYKLEQMLDAQSRQSQKVLPLERALQRETRSGSLKELEIEKLRKEVEALSAQLSTPPKPWWRRLFGA